MAGIPHAYLTADVPGVGGVVKDRLEDFVVHEVPLYEPSGEGEHVYVEIEKTDLSTFEAVERLSSALGVHRKSFAFAGMKDRKGITRQTISVTGVRPEEVEALRVPQLRILRATPHTNKLRIGHLRGNRFRIRMRDIEPDAGRVSEIIARVAGAGLPNYYGPQRFGVRGEAQWIGRAIVRREFEDAIRRKLGRPSAAENHPEIVAARWLFEQYRWAEARKRFPPTYRDEGALLGWLLREGEDWKGAVRRLRPETSRLYVAAFQSWLFNRSLEARLERMGGDLVTMAAGDLAFLHRNGAVFRVEEGEVEEACRRAREFEISVSGPIHGSKMLRPRTGPSADIEARVLREERVGVEDFDSLRGADNLSGGRRPLRVAVEDLGWSIDGKDLVIGFFLPKGSYATTFLREIAKNDDPPPGLLSDRTFPPSAAAATV